MMSFMIAIIVMFFVAYVFHPLFARAFRRRAWIVEPWELEDLQMRKKQLLVAVSDLEYDLRMKKMTTQDYQQLREKLMHEGVAIMKAIEQHSSRAR